MDLKWPTKCRGGVGKEKERGGGRGRECIQVLRGIEGPGCVTGLFTVIHLY